MPRLVLVRPRTRIRLRLTTLPGVDLHMQVIDVSVQQPLTRHGEVPPSHGGTNLRRRVIHQDRREPPRLTPRHAPRDVERTPEPGPPVILKRRPMLLSKVEQRQAFGSDAPLSSVCCIQRPMIVSMSVVDFSYRAFSASSDAPDASTQTRPNLSSPASPPSIASRNARPGIAANASDGAGIVYVVPSWSNVNGPPDLGLWSWGFLGAGMRVPFVSADGQRG